MQKTRECALVILLALLPLSIFAAGKESPQDDGRITLTGQVTDDFGDPLVGVSVFVEGTMTGASTDQDGVYTIDVPAKTKMLVFSCVGFETQRVPIQGNKKIDVVLMMDNESLDEVVIVGYGVQKKESSVAAITQIKGESLANTNMTSVAGALQGQIAGVAVIQNNGMPGQDNTSIKIRGVSSWVSSSPMVLVDGVERDFNNIDPSEIETISVLKDASATAVFGVRGANGVILITTKRGKSGRVKVDFSSEVGVKQPINMKKPEDAYTTGLVMNIARANDNDWGAQLSDEVLEHYRTHDMPYVYTDTDWQDFMLKNGVQHKYNLNVSGGTDFAKVFASISYLHDGNVINTVKNELYDPTWKYDRYNYRFNVDMNVTKTTVVSIDAGGYIGIRNAPFETNNQRLFRPIFTLGPMDGVPFYPAEVLDQYPDSQRPDETGMRLGSTNITNAENPMIANSYSGSRTIKTNNINLSLRLKQDLEFITKGLSLKAQVSYNNLSRWTRTISYKAITYHLNTDLSWVRRLGRDETGREDPEEIPAVGTDSMNDSPYPTRNWYYEASLNYDRTFGRHGVTGLIVGQRRQTSKDAAFPSYEQGLAARVTYEYANRYLFEANLGYNGSEQFAKSKQYGLFPSFALGYNLHNEKFFQPVRKVINKAKFRASWGQVGSDATGGERWLFNSSYSTGGGFQYTPGTPSTPGTSLPTIVEDKAPNINAGWEIATKRDLGVELSFMKNDMFVLSMDFYNEDRDGILLSRQQVPTYIGNQPKKMNLGKTKTKGYEIDLKFQWASKDGSWYVWVKPSIAFSDNRIISKDEPMYTPAYKKEEGHRIGQIFGYHHTGWIQDGNVAMTSARYGGGLFGLGDTEYVDFNGDGIIDSNDMYALGYTQTYPLYTYSTPLGFSWKGLSFDMLFQAVSHISRKTVDNFAWPIHRLSNQVFDFQMDSWSPDNRDAKYPSYHFDTNRTHNNVGDGTPKSTCVYDASYLRLKSLSVSYKLPEKALGKMGVSSMRFYFKANNLFTWAPNYPLADPEASDGGSDMTNGYYPMTRTFTFGFQLGF
ncbi:MAG: SusC/RagA family TonB-linked outer membrane protein [Candidatus Cryptobacteroides sp.]